MYRIVGSLSGMGSVSGASAWPSRPPGSAPSPPASGSHRWGRWGRSPRPRTPGGARSRSRRRTERVVDALNGGRSHIQGVAAATVADAVQAKKFSATADLSRLSEPDVISISVPTPLSKTKDPDVSYVLAATESIRKALRKGQLVVLESTTYPGTTRELMLPALESTGLKVGEDFFLAFSPERVDPGNERFNTRNTPKVIGGITPNCQKVAVALYQGAIDTLIPVSSTEAAELVKILENTFRSVNIGLVNEMAIVCDKLAISLT